MSIKSGKIPSAPPMKNKSGKTITPPPPPKSSKAPKLSKMPKALDVSKVYEAVVELPSKIVDDKPIEDLDGYEPERDKLRNNPDFAKYVKLLKMKVPMKNILLKVKGEGIFTEDQLIIFANPKDIPLLKKEG
jgi:hypothetical protein